MSKYTYEEKIRACEDYFNGICSASQIARDFGLSKLSVACGFGLKFIKRMVQKQKVPYHYLRICDMELFYISKYNRGYRLIIT